MGVGASSGSWASCPSGGRAPSPWIALSAGRHNRDAACACIAACMRMAGQRLTSEVTVAGRNGDGVCLVLCQQAGELNGFHVPAAPNL